MYVQYVPVCVTWRWPNVVCSSACSMSLSACEYSSAACRLNHTLCKEGSTASQWSTFILGFHFLKWIQDDAPPLWKKKKKKAFAWLNSLLVLGAVSCSHCTEEHLWIQWVGSISPVVGHRKVRLVQACRLGSFCSQWKKYKCRDSLCRNPILR